MCDATCFASPRPSTQPSRPAPKSSQKKSEEPAHGEEAALAAATKSIASQEELEPSRRAQFHSWCARRARRCWRTRAYALHDLWLPPTVPSSRCNIASVDAGPSLAQTLAESRVPLLIRGLSWAERWASRSAFLAEWGGEAVTISSGTLLGKAGPEAALQADGGTRRRTTLRGAAEAMRASPSPDDYVFFNVSAALMPELAQLWADVHGVRDGDSDAGLIAALVEAGLPPSRDAMRMRVALGGAGSGLIFHKHELAINVLFAGRKRWFIFADGDPEMPKGRIMKMKAGKPYTTAEWFASVYPRDEVQRMWLRRGVECVQEAGSALYVPGGMMHAVLNDGENLAVAVTKA